MPREGTTPLNMNTGKIDNAGVEAQAAYRISEAWSVAANYSYLHMENPVIAAPEHKLYTEAGFARGRLVGDYGRTVRRGALHFGKGQRPGHGEHRGFRAVEPAGVAAREPLPHAVRPGRNLLAQRYEINAGYPMPRATFIGGIRLDF